MSANQPYFHRYMDNKLRNLINTRRVQPYRMAPRSLLCRAMKVPIFVPPVLILINIYILMKDTGISVETRFELESPHSRSRRSIVSENESNQPGMSIDDEILRLKQINAGRLEHIKNMCELYNQDELFRYQEVTGDALTTPDKSLIYCVMPKVGCTHWKRVFRYINHDYEGFVKSPDDISRVYTHFGPWNNTQVLPLTNETNIEEINKGGFRFMVARDPYARLWSGYLDKMFLPDFWWWLGTKIINETRPNANERSRKCGHDVTFSEFLQYTAINLRRGKHVDMHFEPVYRRCNPCQIHFDVVSKIETQGRDAKLIMNEVWKHNRMKRSVNTEESKKKEEKVDRATEEIKMLTTYQFDIQTRLIQLGKREDCYNQVDIAHRVWQTFQFNGYIGDEYEFPLEEFIQLTDKETIKQALVTKLLAIRQNTSSQVKSSWYDQRKKYLVKAYENIPNYILLGIKHTYAKDFELFQYEKEPDFIFGNRS